MRRLLLRDAALFPLLVLALAAPAAASVDPAPRPAGVEAPAAGVRDGGGAPPEAEEPATRKSTHPAVMFLIAEGMIVANAGLATLSPEGYGGLTLVLSPFYFGFCDDCGTAEAVVGSVALGGIGIYDLTLDTDELDHREIFTRNVVAMHVAAAAIMITVAASRHREGEPGKTAAGKQDEVAFGVFPMRGGIGLSYRRRF